MLMPQICSNYPSYNTSAISFLKYFASEVLLLTFFCCYYYLGDSFPMTNF